MDVLEELIDPEIERSYVERRVEDWVTRLDVLYDRVATWLPDGWTSLRTETVPMEEELMRRVGLSETRLPILGLNFESRKIGRLEPRGLWIIGTNGRVDLILPNGHFLIVDRSDSFNPPDWQIASISDRRSQKRLDRQVLLDLLT